MRADRLLALLMLLQTRGPRRVTAQALATELEVSERTIYRDVDALSAAGVPIYGEAGLDGGYALLDSYRTNLTGLSAGEVRALFMLSIPAPLADLGVSQELKSALLKLTAALPAARQPDEEYVRQRFYLDSVGWQRDEEAVPFLKTIHQAVWENRKLHLTTRAFATQIQKTVAPYGLVVKAGVWYLVCAVHDQIRVHRISYLIDARLANETFERPADFDLAAYWQASCAEREQNRATFIARVRVAPNLVPGLPRYFGNSIREKIANADNPDAEGWLTLELAFESFEAARDRMLAFGRAIEVIEPYSLRCSVLDFAEQIVALYSEAEMKE
ncbi:MAG: WYL domain-containing protein [Chloroflexi bacterium]|nr:WYL domain-containing protein [Chloroflexota bacterium]